MSIAVNAWADGRGGITSMRGFDIVKERLGTVQPSLVTPMVFLSVTVELTGTQRELGIPRLELLDHALERIAVGLSHLCRRPRCSYAAAHPPSCRNGRRDKGLRRLDGC